MSQTYAPMLGTDTLTASRTTINSNFDAAVGDFSGTAFPTSNLVIGMCCYRTDTGKVYRLTSIGPSSWTLIFDMGKTLLQQEDADARYVAVFPPVVNGLIITNDGTSPTTKLNATFDSAFITDANDKPYKIAGQTLSLTMGTTGIGGLDTGTGTVSTWYNIWLITDGVTPGLIMSLSATSPVLPSGYTGRMRIGTWRIDSGGLPLRMIIRGNRADYNPTASSNLTSYPLLASGVSGAWPSALSTASFVPPTAPRVSIMAGSTTGSTTGQNLACGANSAVPVNGAPIYFGAIGSGTVPFNNSTADLVYITQGTVYWQCQQSGGQVRVVGYTDKINAN